MMVQSIVLQNQKLNQEQFKGFSYTNAHFYDVYIYIYEIVFVKINLVDWHSAIVVHFLIQLYVTFHILIL